MRIRHAYKRMSVVKFSSVSDNSRSYGAIMALAPEYGMSTGASLDDFVPIHSVFAGTASSHPSSCDDSSRLLLEYHEPA